VRPGDTLSGIASALAVPGGWPALYAANRQAIGPDPDVIRPGTVLTAPGVANPARYTVAPGDTLSAISAALAVPGGWPALYATNREAIGPDPDVIRPGTVLAVPRLVPVAAPQPTGPGQPARSAAPASSPRPRARPSRQAAVPASASPAAAPPAATANVRATKASGGTAPSGGMPRWLVEVLIAVGVLAGTAFAGEPAVALARRRRAACAGRGAPRPAAGRRRRDRRAIAKARVVLADHDRLIVTYSVADHTVYVLTPPGEDPRAVLRAARLVLPEDTYEDLALHLGVPSAWPPE
jgi:3D (Asp-Asp-Asp) domain-containing protein